MLASSLVFSYQRRRMTTRLARTVKDKRWLKAEGTVTFGRTFIPVLTRTKPTTPTILLYDMTFT